MFIYNSKHLILPMVLLPILFLSSGCTKAFITKRLKNDFKLSAQVLEHQPPESLKEFDGLDSLTERNRIVNILLVPGSRKKDWTYYNATIQNIASKLEFKLEDFSCPYASTSEGSITPIGSGKVWKWTYLRGKGEESKRLNFYYVNWTLVSDPTKEVFFDYVNAPLDLKSAVKTTFLSRKIQDDYLIDMVGELPLYRQADYHKEILQTLFAAFHLINEETNPTEPEETPLVSLSGSMGNQLILNGFNALLVDNPQLISFHNGIIQDIEEGRNELVKKKYQDLICRIKDLMPPSSLYFKNEIHESYLMAKSHIDANKFEELKDTLSYMVKQIYMKDMELGDNIGQKLKMSFLLNNHLVFSKIMEYSSKDYRQGLEIDDLVKKELIGLFSLKQKGDPLKVVSFFDPNDIIGFPFDSVYQKGRSIPGKKTFNENFFNIPIRHTNEWRVQSAPLKGIVGLIDDGSSDLSPLKVLDKNDKVIVSNGYDAPSILSKTNPNVLKYIVRGFHPEEPKPDSLKLANFIVEPVQEAPKTKSVKWGSVEVKKKKRSLSKGIKGGGDLIATLQKGGKIAKPTDLPYLYPENLYKDEEFQVDGIKQYFQRAKGLKPGAKLYVLTIHGMKDKKPDHYDFMAKKMAKQMGFVLRYDRLLTIPVRKSYNPKEKNGLESLFGLREMTFKNSEGKEIVFKVIHWSPMTRPIKERLNLLSKNGKKEAEKYGIETSFTHQTVKDIIVQDGFVDVFLALGDRDFMNSLGKSIAFGMGRIEKVLKEDDQVIFISGSLGSGLLYEYIINKITDKPAYSIPALPISLDELYGFKDSELQDTGNLEKVKDYFKVNKEAIEHGFGPDTMATAELWEYYRNLAERQKERKVAKRLIAQTRAWYMLTNQIALIGLKYFDEERRNRPFNEQVWHELEKNYQLEEVSERFEFDMDVLAFNDPNDVLTMRVGPINSSSQLKDKFRVKNVPIRAVSGYDVEIFHLYQLIRKVDKYMYRKIKKDQKERFPRSGWCAYKKSINKSSLPKEDKKKAKKKAKEEFYCLRNQYKDIRLRRVNSLNDEIAHLTSITSNMAIDPTIRHEAYRQLVTKEKELKLEKEWQKDHTVFLIPGFYKIFDKDLAKKNFKQPYIIRYDKAHDQVSKNGRVLSTIINGLGND
ncbi:MAG: hypothetical protein MRZ79_08730 [Bacteroidia bacterium]|nr:hypothetical protein [Bacteroidia bacterium]